MNDEHNTPTEDQTIACVWCRHRADITPEHRIAWRGRTLQIHGVIDPDGRRRLMALTCSEVQ